MEQGKKLKAMMLAALFAALTASVSPINIPLGFTPVPITLQTIIVLLSGALLGPASGALSQALYVLVGAIGLPVFAGGKGGLGALLGPTGGYLFGFIAASYVVGKISNLKEKPSLKRLVLAMATGTLVIYAFGLSWALVSTGMSFNEILVGWVLPFIAGDVIKMLAAALIAKKALDTTSFKFAISQ